MFKTSFYFTGVTTTSQERDLYHTTGATNGMQ